MKITKEDKDKLHDAIMHIIETHVDNFNGMIIDYELDKLLQKFADEK